MAQINKMWSVCQNESRHCDLIANEFYGKQ